MLLAGNIVLVVLLLWGLVGEIGRSQSLQTDIDRLESQARALEDQNARLTTLGTALATNDRLEREARVKLGLQKPGESVIIVQDTRGQSGAIQPVAVGSASDTPVAQLSNPQKWWKYFFQ